jgi:dienelactone hydrolase
MRYRFLVLLVVASLLVACGGSNATPQPTAAPTNVPPQSTAVPPTAPAVENPELIAKAQSFVDKFFQGDDAAIIEMFDATMKSAFPADKIEETRTSLAAQVGAFKQQIGATRTEKAESGGVEYDIVYVTCEFEKATLDTQVVFDPAGLIAGLHFVPTAAAPAVEYVPPSYVNPDSFTEEEVTVGSVPWALPGTLTRPKGNGPFPVIVLVHGSGPNDRDETIGPNKPFRDLAWGLASRGIAVLRYEKRTKEHAAQFTPEVLAKLTLADETSDDALAAVALLRQTPGIDPNRIFVLGHSQGGMALPRIGAADPQIAGLISLAGPTRPLEDLFLEQVTYIAGLGGTISPEAQAQLDELAAQVTRVKGPDLSPDTPSADLPLGIPATFWLDLRGYAPAEVAAGLNIPMLILQGERDYQVTTADFDGWKAALSSRPDVKLILYPDLNHLFMTGEGKAVPAEYDVVGHVAEKVIVDIADWVLGNK